MTDGKIPIRKAPAYQEYAADVLADARYRMMTLSERGIWDTLRKECWVNGSVPSDTEELSRLLRLPVGELDSVLTKDVRSYFEVIEDRIICTELEKYRKELDERRQKKIDGGKIGGQRSQLKRRTAEAIAKGTLKYHLKPLSKGESSRDEQSRVEVRGIIDSISNQEWLDDYEKSEDAF